MYHFSGEGTITPRVAPGKNALKMLVAQARPLYANRHADGAARKTILQKTKGAWADNPLIDRALAELNRGWNEWAEKS
ncbi:MAG: hypothetical protein XD69_1188 [Clostridia bacterium 62_21]|nr:MAG: hypothetical protein XD69_1188 [Clostridia bacterium 62_21]HAG06561.1 hypothetical protein [Peptococcaceae bacterium]